MALTTDDRDWIRGTIVEALEAIVLPRFDDHDRRFDEHDRRFDDHDRRFDEHDRMLNEQKRLLTEQGSHIQEMRHDIRDIKQRLDSLEGRVEALENDIKEIYAMVAKMNTMSVTDKKFAKLPLQKKILLFDVALVKLAKEAGVVLPR